MARKSKTSGGTTERIRMLFGVAPKEFTKERNALAAELKKEGRGKEAAQVKAIKKPSTATYLVNLVAQRYPADVEAMLDAGDALEKAQRSGNTADFHERSAEHRALISSLLDRTEAIAEEIGVSFPLAMRSKVETTFRVASGSDEDRAAVASGTLMRELEASGFDALFAAGGIRAPKQKMASARTASAPKPKKKAVDVRAVKAAEKELQRAKSKQADLEERAEKLQKELAASTTNLERAQKRLEALKAKADD